MSSSLAKSCQCLGIQTKWFEGEFLKLLRKKIKKGEQKVTLGGSKRKYLKLSQLEKEMTKLECSMVYKSDRRGEGTSNPDK